MKKFREMKKNNKGFSLVELIVVIAIMVVLVAVLGSTILGYVDKSKYSKDIQALDAVKTAVSTFVADPECNYTSGTGTTLMALMQPGADPNGVIASTLNEVFAITREDDAADALGAVTEAKFNNSSAVFAGLTAENVSVTITNGAVSISVPVADGQEDDYDAYLVGTAYTNKKATFTPED